MSVVQEIRAERTLLVAVLVRPWVATPWAPRQTDHGRKSRLTLSTSLAMSLPSRDLTNLTFQAGLACITGAAQWQQWAA